MDPPCARAEFTGSSSLLFSVWPSPLCWLQEAFDVQHLPLWWVRWLLPPAQRKAGDGICFPHQTDWQDPLALDWSDAYHVLISDRV